MIERGYAEKRRRARQGRSPSPPFMLAQLANASRSTDSDMVDPLLDPHATRGEDTAPQPLRESDRVPASQPINRSLLRSEQVWWWSFYHLSHVKVRSVVPCDQQVSTRRAQQVPAAAPRAPAGW